MKSLNEQLLDDDPESQAIEADDTAQYEPDTDSQVVATEPPIIAIGRGKRRAALREVQSQQG